MNWGFVGTGRIAERIMAAFALLPNSHVVAAYTRDPEKLDAFCTKWQVPHRCSSLEELANDPMVEIIYLATPHIVHAVHFRTIAAAGKPILCEKPMGMSLQETEEMISLARQKNFFLMEGLWTLCFPLMQWLQTLICSQSLGQPYNVMADFSYHSPYDPELRFFRKDLGGGSMRGAGIYPLVAAMTVFGEKPDMVRAMADMKNNVDLRCGALLRFPSGGMAQIYSGFQGESVQGMNIAFEKGAIWIPDFWHPAQAIICQNGKETHVDFPYEFPGFQFELLEVERCVQAGEKESCIVPLSLSLQAARALDDIYAALDMQEAAKQAEG